MPRLRSSPVPSASPPTLPSLMPFVSETIAASRVGPSSHTGCLSPAVPIVLLLPNMEDEAVAEAGQQPGGGALVDDAVAAGAARGVGGGGATNGVQALCWLPSHIAPSWKYACTTHRAVSEEDARVLEWCVGVRVRQRWQR